MNYRVGDRLLLATDDPNGIALAVETISAVEAEGEGQLLTIGERRLTVGPDGTGDHSGVSVLPLSDELAREFYLRGQDTLVVTASTTDPFEISQDLDGPGEGLRREGPGQ